MKRRSSRHQAPVMVIRGISDLADGTKDGTDRSGWRKVAAENAAAFAFALIAERSTEVDSEDGRQSSQGARAVSMPRQSGGHRSLGQKVKRRLLLAEGLVAAAAVVGGGARLLPWSQLASDMPVTQTKPSDGSSPQYGSTSGTTSAQMVLPGHSKGVKALALRPNSTMLASGGEDHLILLWNGASRRVENQLIGHSGDVDALAFSPNGVELASASADGTVRIWAMSTLNLLGEPLDHQGRRVRAVAFSPDGAMLASGSEDGVIRIWDVNTRQILHSFKDPATSEKAAKWVGHSAPVKTVAFHPDVNVKILASGADDNLIKIWDAATGQLTNTLDEHDDRVESVGFSPNGEFLASGADDGRILLWNTTTSYKLIRGWVGHGIYVRSVAFSSDSLRLASAGGDSMVRLWDRQNGANIRTFEGHPPEAARAVVFGSDDRLLVSCGSDHRVRWWPL
jgi:WD40 repeat protein